MVLTGKQALEYSGGVSAEDNFGIGGYERIMGPNGQAQYWAQDLVDACRILLSHYEHTYSAPGGSVPTSGRDPGSCRPGRPQPHPQSSASDFACIGDIFSEERNPGRKKPFDIRAVMSAVADRITPPGTLDRHGRGRERRGLGRPPGRLAGVPDRDRVTPADSPRIRPSGRSGSLDARHAVPAVVEEDCSGDQRRERQSPPGRPCKSLRIRRLPESMRRLQLEYGAEIGRAVVNFRGPMVFCVISRYHGGAFVVFSARSTRIWRSQPWRARLRR